jgi:hypothetical protein
MRRGREARAKRLLQGISVPDEVGAQERAWAVARSAYVGRLSVPRRRSRLRFVPVPALLLGVAAVMALTPAGAAVDHWINSALSPRSPAASNVISLPLRGSRLLVTSPSGTWIVKDRGARHRLGQWDVATWSPHGLYVAAASAHRLVALDPSGAVLWSAPVAGARYLSWFEPQGSINSRISFISGGSLWLNTGDNRQKDLAPGATARWSVATNVAPVAPAWRPGPRYELVYASAKRQIVSVDDSGHRLWTSPRLSSSPKVLAFSGDGSRLLALSSQLATVFDGTGRPLGSVTAPARQPLVDGALSPDGQTLALLSDRTITLVGWSAGPGASQAVFTTRITPRGAGLSQLAWSPNSQWLLATWPGADEWVFVRAKGPPSDQIVSHVSQQFRGVFPRLDGWCCTAVGGSGPG